MKRSMQPPTDATRTLRSAALRYPEAEEGIACAGTALEKRTIKARNKAFLFLGVADVMLKLRDSLVEASQFAAKEPDRYKVGAHGWVTVTLDNGATLPIEVLLRWIDESYRLLAPKQLIAALPGDGRPTEEVKETRKANARKKSPK